MTPRMNANLMKVLFVIVILMAMMLQSLITAAQPGPGNNVRTNIETPT